MKCIFQRYWVTMQCKMKLHYCAYYIFCFLRGKSSRNSKWWQISNMNTPNTSVSSKLTQLAVKQGTRSTFIWYRSWAGAYHANIVNTCAILAWSDIYDVTRFAEYVHGNISHLIMVLFTVILRLKYHDHYYSFWMKTVRCPMKNMMSQTQ